jgi:hypothetical protein
MIRVKHKFEHMLLSGIGSSLADRILVLVATLHDRARGLPNTARAASVSVLENRMLNGVCFVFLARVERSQPFAFCAVRRIHASVREAPISASQ